AKIIELDKNRNNVVLSRRAWLEETQREQREEFLGRLAPGEVRHGVVSSVVNFGVFVDLGGMDGLVHVSELSWRHVDHPSSVVSVGDEIDVMVMEVDQAKERISLSLKATQPDPWQEFANAHRVGELVYGRVTKLVPFGAFIQVGDGIEGLVHISEMATHHVDLPEQVVTPGEELWVKIIEIDLARRRISLSIKQAAEGGEVAAEYREAFGEHAYDEEGNYIGTAEYAADFTPETEAQQAWAEYVSTGGTEDGPGAEGAPSEVAGAGPGADLPPATAGPGAPETEAAGAHGAPAQPALAEPELAVTEPVDAGAAVAEPEPAVTEPVDAEPVDAGAAVAEPEPAVTEPVDAGPADAGAADAGPEPGSGEPESGTPEHGEPRA
ncbi:MAG: S1 RNA-binding domain-containing protein, partial [Acidimicrobiales bacterium]